MQIELKLNRDFENKLDELSKKYGEDFLYINGIHPSQLDFSEFLNKFVNSKTMADATIDPNANANYADIRSFMTEKAKSEDKLFGLAKIYLEIKKMWGKRTADNWLEQEFSKGFYLNDSASASYYPYCFKGDTKFITKEGTKSLVEMVGKEVQVLNRYGEWEDATVNHFGIAPLMKLTLKNNDTTKVLYPTGNHRWFVKRDGGLIIYETHFLSPGLIIPGGMTEGVAVTSEISENDWEVVSIEETDLVEDIYCVTAPETHTFTLDENIMTGNCWANDLTKLATEGLFFLKQYNHQPPKHLTTFFDDVIEFVSFLSNRQSGKSLCPSVSLPLVSGVY